MAEVKMKSKIKKELRCIVLSKIKMKKKKQIKINEKHERKD